MSNQKNREDILATTIKQRDSAHTKIQILRKALAALHDIEHFDCALDENSDCPARAALCETFDLAAALDINKGPEALREASWALSGRRALENLSAFGVASVAGICDWLDERADEIERQAAHARNFSEPWKTK